MMAPTILLLAERLDTVCEVRSRLGRESYLVDHSLLDQDAASQTLIEDPDPVTAEGQRLTREGDAKA